MPDSDTSSLENFRPPVKLKLCMLWTATMFCYAYADYFGLFQPGRLAGMNAGRIEPLGAASPWVMAGVSIMMAIPAAMTFLALVLPPRPDRWINIVLGLAYTAIIIMTMPGAPLFYLLFCLIEIVFTLLVAWYAWTWPRVAKEAAQTQ
jgi:hypothetical protein